MNGEPALIKILVSSSRLCSAVAAGAGAGEFRDK